MRRINFVPYPLCPINKVKSKVGALFASVPKKIEELNIRNNAGMTLHKEHQMEHIKISTF